MVAIIQSLLSLSGFVGDKVPPDIKPSVPFIDFSDYALLSDSYGDQQQPSVFKTGFTLQQTIEVS